MINIVYEDNHLLVVEKPINMPSQKDASGDMDVLNSLKQYIKDKHNKPGDVYLGLVHRLDRPVGGLMVFARTSKAAMRLSTDMKNKLIKKTYIAVVTGEPLKEATLIDYMVKNTKTNVSKITTEVLGKKAILHYKLIKKINDKSLVEINLETGRSHQIRVQMANSGLPLLGDQKYNKIAKKEPIALFASRLELIHPTTKEKLVFKLDLPNSYPWNLFK